MSEQTKSILCPHCAAPLELEETQSVITCPYCSFTSKVEDIEKKVEHYMLPVKYNINEIRTELIGDLLKHPGTPNDLHQSLKIKNYELKFVPFWIVTVHNRTEYEGEGEYATYSNRYKSGYRNIRFHLKPEKGVFDDEREFTIYAAEQMDDDLLNFDIATRGKRYFQKKEAKKVKAAILDSVLNLDQAKIQGVNSIREIHKGLILKEITRIQRVKDNPEVTSVYLLHIPFYFLDFKVGNREFTAKMDASTGRTVTTEIPRKVSYVAQIITMSTLFGIIALVGAYFLVNGQFQNIAGFAVIAGLVYAGRTIFVALKRRFKERAD